MKIFLSIIAIIVSICNIQAADRQIKGTVLSSEDKLPLTGASVYVSPEDLKAIKHDQTSIAAVADVDGLFSLNVPDGIKRVYASYLGFLTQEISLTAANTYLIELEPSAIMLQDFVVTGYQEVERRKLTAAISKIDISDETVGAVKSIDQALSGKIAGLSVVTETGSPGAPAKIRIRGTSSLSGTQDPLWVLDGIPLEGTEIPKMEDLRDIDNIYTSSIAGINPADIESITVLKDAAATAIYGARAANGVIVITTKKGKKGKTKVNFSTRLSYTPNVDIDKLNLLSSEEKTQLDLDLLRSNYTYRKNKGGVAQIINGYGEMASYKSGGWNALSPAAQTDIYNLSNINTDWNDILFRDVFNQEYNLSLSGGNDVATYYASTGFYDEQGNVTGVDMSRFNITGKTEFKLSEVVKFGVSLFANQRKKQSYLTDTYGFSNPVYYSRKANPYQQVYDSNGQYIYDDNIQGMGDSVDDFNIFEERNNTSNKYTAQSFSSIFDLELRFSDKIKFRSQAGVQSDKTDTEKIADQESFAMRTENTRATRLINGVSKSFLPLGGFDKNSGNKLTQITGKAMLDYRTEINRNHEIEGMLGSEIRKTWYETLFSAGYGYDRKTLTTKPVIFPKEDDANYFPLFSKTYTENAYVSWFSTFSYSFLRKYTLGGSIRFDGSDLFGVDKKYRYLPLYSVSGLWRISEEPFMKNVSWINNLLFRASYGLQGNIDKNTSPFVMGTYYERTILPGYSEKAISVSSPPNDKLRWEKTQNVNAGFDFSVLEDAINVSANYYYRHSSDLIGMQTIPLESGFYSKSINWASMNNQGVEVSISSRNIHTKTFSWFTDFNIGYNANKVTKVNIPENQTTPSLEGYPVGAIFGYRFGGLDSEGYPLFITQDGQKVTAKEYFNLKLSGATVIPQLTAEEQRDLYSYIGTSEPVYSGGLTNTFRYKAFEASINCIFNLGHYVQTVPSYSPTRYDRGMNSNRDILNRWTAENTNTSLYLLMPDNYRLEEYRGFLDFRYERNFDTWIKKGDHMRVQSIRIGYNLPENILQFFKMTSGVVSLEGRNLFVIASDYNNYLDPETMGNEYAQPIPKTIIFSLNLNF